VLKIVLEAEFRLSSARPEIGKSGITGHQKNKIPVAATLESDCLYAPFALPDNGRKS
jgi:hypothetical protein